MRTIGVLNPQLLPVIVLINRRGLVVHSWGAVLDPQQQSEIGSAVTSELAGRAGVL